MDRENLTKATNLPKIRTVGPTAPFEWLSLGWESLSKTGFAGTIYGALFIFMGYAIITVYATYWQLTMGLTAGFLLIGPFLATGIYDLSRQLENGDKVSLLKSFYCWNRNPGAIAFFAVILTFCMIVWARVSIIIFALTSNISFPSLQGVISSIFSFSNLPFILLWGLIGSLFAILVFAISAVSMPMLLDRRSDTVSAIVTSVRALLTNPKAMFVWALIIAAFIGMSLIAGLIGLLITAPLIGHATWHAYRAIVE